MTRSRVAPVPLSPPLVGRDHTLRVVDQRLTAAAEGAGSCVVLEGPAGMGKTRLVTTVAHRAEQLGFVVAAGRATRIDRAAPLSTLRTALRRSTRPLPGTGGAVETEQSGYRLIDRLGEAVEELARERPVAVVIDDFHWADELSALALRILVPSLQPSSVFWLLAQRPGARALADMGGDDATVLSLEPLDQTDLIEFCTHVLGAPPDAGVLQLAAGTGGNPFLLEELLVTLLSEGRIQVRDGFARPVGDGLPIGFVAAVQRRVGELSADSGSLLEAGAVLSGPFTVHAAAGVLGRPVPAMLAATREAVSAGLLVDDGARLTFRHDLIREAVYDSVPGTVRQALHREAVPVLRREGSSGAEVTEHFLRGAQRADESTLAMFRDALADIAPDAPSAAADLILRLLELQGSKEPAHLPLVADAVRFLASAGRLAEARALAEQALAHGMPPAAESAVLIGLAEALKHAGQDRGAVEFAERALSGTGSTPGERAHLLAVQAHAFLQLDDLSSARTAAHSAVELGRTTHADVAVVVGLCATSMVAYADGDVEGAIQQAREGVAAAESSGGEARHRHPRLWLARALVAADRFPEAKAMYAADKLAAAELGTAWSQPMSHQFHAELELAAGKLEDARAEAEAGLRVAGQLNSAALTPALLATLAHLAALRGEPQAAAHLLARADHCIEQGICALTEELHWERAVCYAAMGEHEAATRSFRKLVGVLGERPYLLVQEPLAGPWLVRFALAAGDREAAVAVASAARQVAVRSPRVVSLRGAADHTEGLVEDDRDLLHAAVSAHRAGPRPLCLAYALEDTSGAERRAGDQEAAVNLLKQARAIYAECGSHDDADRARRGLRALGVRSAAAPRTARHKSGWAGLTTSELRVVRLVAEGRTNREVAAQLFLSPHTVDSHIRHAFAKLDVSNRVELARIVLAHDDPYTS